MSNQTTYFAFTLSNYTEENLQKLHDFAKSFCYRFMYGKEKAPTTGTNHLQGCFQLKQRTRLETIKSIIGIPEIHLESQRKVYLANAHYCQKCGDCWYWPDKETNFKKGNPITTKNQKYDQAIKLALLGQFDKIEGEILLKYEPKLIKKYLDNLPVENTLLDNKYGNFFNDFFILIYGITGTGKSFSVEVIQGCLNMFWKQYCETRKKEYKPFEIYYKKCNKWWDGYRGQDIVVIEEIEPAWSRISGNMLKQLCDQYPFPVECKGATINKIRPLFVILTSNYDLKTLCSKEDGTLINENFEPLKRRLFCVQLNSRFDFFNWPRYDHLTTYFDTHEEVKKERKQTILNKHYRLIEENCSIQTDESTIGDSITASLTPVEDDEPILLEEEETNLYEELVEYADQNGKKNLTIDLYVINDFNFTFTERNEDLWRDLNFYKNLIKAYKSLINLNKKRILVLMDDSIKLRRKLDNLNEGYKFLNSISSGEDSIFPTYKEKASSLSDIMLQIQNVGNQLELNDHEIQHFHNLNDVFNNKIWNFKLEINYILMNNNKELKNYFNKLFE